MKRATTCRVCGKAGGDLVHGVHRGACKQEYERRWHLRHPGYNAASKRKRRRGDRMGAAGLKKRLEPVALLLVALGIRQRLEIGADAFGGMIAGGGAA